MSLSLAGLWIPNGCLGQRGHREKLQCTVTRFVESAEGRSRVGIVDRIKVIAALLFCHRVRVANFKGSDAASWPVPGPKYNTQVLQLKASAGAGSRVHDMVSNCIQLSAALHHVINDMYSVCSAHIFRFRAVNIVNGWGGAAEIELLV